MPTFQLLVLLVAGCMFCVTCWMSFCERIRDCWWYMPLALAVSSVTTMIWFWAVKKIGDKDDIYVLSMWWDAMVVLIFYLMPILLYGVRLDRWGVFGVLLIIAGLVVIKSRHG